MNATNGQTPVAPEVGPTDSILDVPGVRLGQVEMAPTDETPEGSTGVTAVVTADGALGAVDVRGAAPATRETDALSAVASGERVHAIVLAGRSVFGLAAADGATTELEARGIGLPVERPDGKLTIPIVAGAAIFDFAHGDPAIRPGPADGRAAIVAALDGEASEQPRSGNAGAGMGATTGSIAEPRLKDGAGVAIGVSGIGGAVPGAGRRHLVFRQSRDQRGI